MKLKAAIASALEFCYPGRCGFCHEASAFKSFLCNECEAKLIDLESAGACSRCARPLQQWGDPCPYCVGKGLRPFEKIVALGVFADPIKELIHHMKYHRRWSIGEHLADRIARQTRAAELLEETDVIVPVPLYRWRQVDRGYNQSDVIARRLGALFRKRVAHPVKRIRNTPPQTEIRARDKRQENVRDAFKLKSAASVKGKKVVLVDDVLTTGATLQAVARALMHAEPASVSAIVIGVADPRGRGFEAI